MLGLSPPRIGHNTGLVGVAGGREVGWESVGGGAAQWSRDVMSTTAEEEMK